MNGSKKIFIEFFGWMAFLWLLWFWSGGPSRISEIDQPFLKPPSPLNTGKDFGSASRLANVALRDVNLSIGNSRNEDSKDSNNEKRLDDYNKSKYAGAVQFFLAKDGEGEISFLEITDPDSNKNAINITGWKIRSAMTNDTRIIPEGVNKILQGRVNKESDILLYPGEKAIVVPGLSPIGVSFRMNKCIGYLEQFQEFSPHLPQYCPHPAFDEELKLDDSCIALMKTVERCNAYVEDYPENISDDCKKTMERRMSYNGCVSDHSLDSDFYKGNWRVYVGEKDVFGSKNGDIISIYDAEGRLIESVFYNQ